MIKKTTFILTSIIIINYVYAQTYHTYYSKIDSAYYFYKLNNNTKSDSIFGTVFSKFEGFSADYITACINIYKIDRNKSLKYLEKAVYYGEHKKNLLFHLKQANIVFTKKEIKKAYRLRNRNLRTSWPIRRMLIRDIIARRSNKHNKISKADSINYNKIIYLIKSDTTMFNRLYHNDVTNQSMEILLIHQKFSKIKNDWNLFYSLVEKGRLNRFFLGNIIERESMWGGKSIKVDTINNQIDYAQIRNHKFKNGFLYCSALGSINYFLKGKSVIIPINPNTKSYEYNRLRSYLFLPNYELFKTTYQSQYSFPNIEEFDTYLKKDDINY